MCCSDASVCSPSAARIERLRAAYGQAGSAAMLVRDTSSIAWLTAFDGVFDDERAHALFVDGARAVLHTDSRYATACERAARAAGGCVAVDAERVGHGAWAAQLWRASMQGADTGSASGAGERAEGDTGAVEGAGATPGTSAGASAGAVEGAGATPGVPTGALAIEDGMTLAEYRALERAFANASANASAEGTDASVPDAPAVQVSVPGVVSVAAQAAAPGAAHATAPSFVETSGLVVGLRAVKDASEVKRLRAAQAITDAAFEHIVGFMRPGLAERAVQLELEDFMLRHGADGLAFSSIVATGANGASPHAIPGDTVLEAGQCVVLDFGARACGYCSDMTRTVFLGAPSGDMLAAWETMRRANEEVEAMLRPGVTGAEAHELAERILEEGGFGGRMGHGLGHGVGLDIHEEPVLSPRNKRALVAGNVVTVEPGIYVPGAFGMRLEDFGIITPDGFEVFTSSTHEMVVI